MTARTSAISPGELAEALPAHLAAQRWFGGPPGPVTIGQVDVLREAWPALLRVEVVAGQRWQLLVGLRPADQWDVADVGELATIGPLHTEFGPAFGYDGLVDPELGLVLLGHLAPDVGASTVRPVLAEQSNTSLVYDERWFLKVFRRLNGPNPDAEVPAALARQGFVHVARPHAVWQVGGDDCAVLQPYLAGALEGWAMALTSLRDLFGGDAGADPADAGGDFAPEAARLGTLTADLHRALAAAFGTAPGDPAAWAATLRARMASVTHPELDPAAAIRAADALAALADAGLAVRAHGDYHLGQVLYCDEGWFVVDFEGEPAADAAARAAWSSPLRDVAGMVRSFHYAALVASAERGESVAAPAAAWEERNRRAFLEAYQAASRGTGLVPADPASFATVLSAFELDKAIYEVGYEQAHRPDWVGFALAGVHRLAGPA